MNLLTIPQTAKRLGVGKKHVYRLIAERELLCVDVGIVGSLARVREDSVEAYIEEQLATRSPSTANQRYRSLQQFFKWLAEEGQIKASPMANMKPPNVPVVPPPARLSERLR